MEKIFFISLGCARNLVDSEFALDRIVKSGYKIIENPENADIGIVNTCGFIEDAKKESLDIILDLIQLKNEHKLKKIIVGGCLSQRYREKLLEELPEIDAVLGTNWNNIEEILDELDSQNRIINIKKSPSLLPYSERKGLLLTPAHYAYLKISEGCSNKCSYCAIPGIKGRHKSRVLEEIISEAESLVERGVREINIVAQDTTAYGVDIYGFPRIVELLERISDIPGNFWLRLLYLHPARITDELISCYKKLPKLCKYIDIPLQHINDKILKSMRRRVTKEYILDLVKKLRREIKNSCLRTTFIVGFPGEGEDEFQELIDFISAIKFERLGCFIYSREEGTEAYNFKNHVPLKEKKRRFDILMKKQKDIATAVNKKFRGQKLRVIVDDVEEKYYLARTEYDAPEVDGIVYVEKKKGIRRGDFLDVKIKDTLEYDLVAEVA